MRKLYKVIEDGFLAHSHCFKIGQVVSASIYQSPASFKYNESKNDLLLSGMFCRPDNIIEQVLPARAVKYIGKIQDSRSKREGKFVPRNSPRIKDGDRFKVCGNLFLKW